MGAVQSAGLELSWTQRQLVQRRRWLAGLALGLLLLTFNGYWRIGRDSAIYRGLARSLADGEGYEFLSYGDQIYPGLPLLLAGIERFAGGQTLRPIAAVAAIALCGAACVALSYLLIRSAFPDQLWLAAAVASGVSINAWFLRQSQELMTDVPFLLGVLLTLIGHQRLIASDRPHRRRRFGAVAILGMGLLIAASMRPTFLVLAAALGITSLIGVIRRRDRVGHAWAIAILAVVMAIAWGTDPRTRGFSPLGGRYEREALRLLRHAPSIIRIEAVEALTRHLPDAVMGGSFNTSLGLALSAMLLTGSLMLMRRHPLWGWLVIGTMLATVLQSTTPRYYLMILPILLCGWFCLADAAASRLASGVWREAVLIVALSLVVVSNLGKVVPLIREQRAGDFFRTYDNGRYPLYFKLAELIRQRIAPQGVVIAPRGTIVAYLSGRRVITDRDLSDLAAVGGYPRALRRLGVTHAVYPPKWYEHERWLKKLLEREGVVPVRFAGRVRDRNAREFTVAELARVRILSPQEDWRNEPVRPWPGLKNYLAAASRPPASRPVHSPGT